METKTRKRRNKASPQPRKVKPRPSVSPSEPTIKFARPEDITQVVALGYKSFIENDLSGLGCEPDFDSVTMFITELVFNHVVLIKRNPKDDKVVDGVLALRLDSLWWSTDPVLTSVLLYTKPETRQFKVVRELLKASQEYAIMNKLPIVFEIFARKDVAKKKKLLQYFGFRELGSFYVYDGR